jgi:putative SOS response-associated peptidase YedK
VETCTILTTAANKTLAHLHARMPVILDPASDGLRLDPPSSLDALRALLVSYPGERMAAFPVSLWVFDARLEGPHCLETAC